LLTRSPSPCSIKNVPRSLRSAQIRLEQLTAETERADANGKEANIIRNEVKNKAEELAEREKSWQKSYSKEKDRLQSEYATLKMRNANLEVSERSERALMKTKTRILDMNPAKWLQTAHPILKLNPTQLFYNSLVLLLLR